MHIKKTPHDIHQTPFSWRLVLFFLLTVTFLLIQNEAQSAITYFGSTSTPHFATLVSKPNAVELP